MLIELFRNCTLFLFWFLAFGVMLVVDACAIIIRCYFLKRFGEELANASERRRQNNEIHN